MGLLRRVASPVARDATDGVDAVLLSHLHGDHVDTPSLRRVGSDVPVVGSPTAAAWLRRRGFSDVRELGAGGATRIGRVSIEATRAQHDGRRWPFGEQAAAVGFVVDRVYFAGDTDLFPEMSDLAGRVDVALLPIWGWGPTLGPGHLDPERAAEAAATIRPRVAIPIHWGTLTPLWGRPKADALRRPADDFAAAVQRLAPDVAVRILEPGEREVVRAPRP